MKKGKLIFLPISKDALEWLKVAEERYGASEVDTMYVPFQPSQLSTKRSITTKPGAKETYFSDYIINNDETDWIINFLKKHIDKDRPKLAALWVMAAIEAGKVSLGVSAPSIEREFGVKAVSVKPHLTKYKTPAGKKSFEKELKPYVTYFMEHELLLKKAS